AERRELLGVFVFQNGGQRHAAPPQLHQGVAQPPTDLRLRLAVPHPRAQRRLEAVDRFLKVAPVECSNPRLKVPVEPGALPNARHRLPSEPPQCLISSIKCLITNSITPPGS